MNEAELYSNLGLPGAELYSFMDIATGHTVVGIKLELHEELRIDPWKDTQVAHDLREGLLAIIRHYLEVHGS